jgi:hypothetical protein
MRNVRRGLTAIAVAALAVSLTACGAGKNAQTNHPYMPASGRNVDVPSPVSYHEPWMAIRNTILVTSTVHPSLSTLVVAFVNNDVDDDLLTSVTVDGVAQKLPSGGIPLPNHTLVSVGAPTSLYFISVKGIAAKPGDWVAVTLAFKNAARASFNILNVFNTNDYVKVPVLPKSVALTRPLLTAG